MLQALAAHGLPDSPTLRQLALVPVGALGVANRFNLGIVRPNCRTARKQIDQGVQQFFLLLLTGG